MKTRLLIVGTCAVLAAAAAFALSLEHVDWFNGPVQALMSKEEIAKWNSLRTDDEAKAFIALFWARRDPTPDTPRNEAREEFESRVAWADANLKHGKTRGAMTDRGRTLLLYGTPKRIERSAEAAPRLRSTANIEDTPAWTQWVYEGEDTKAIFGTTRALIRFADRYGYRIERGRLDLDASQGRAVTRMIVSPNLTAPPVFNATGAAAPPVAPARIAATTAGVATALTTPALATAVNEFKAAAKNPFENKAFATWGEYVTAQGEYYVPVLLYVPQSAGITGDQNVTFFGVVEDASGKSVLAFEQPARLAAAKDDLFVDRSLRALPAGKHRGIFGIARDGQPLAIASTDMTLAGSLDKDAAGVSQLLLSNFVAAAQTATEPTEPFSFGGVKVVPKVDRTFRTSDELWFFFELRNPGVAEAIAATEASATGATPEAKPRIQVKMEVEGKGPDGKPIKRAAPPREMDAVPMKGVPGHYGIGSAIPLESFKPGDYTITLKVMDTVKKASYTLSESFKVVQ